MRKVRIAYTATSGAQVPKYASQGSSGADLFAHVQEPVILLPGSHALIPTGITLQIPSGFEAQVRPRSGLALKHGVTVLNAPGTIDSDYRGEIMVILANFGSKDFTVKSRDRIAQVVIAPVSKARFYQKGKLADSERGRGGFGSSGV